MTGLARCEYSLSGTHQSDHASSSPHTPSIGSSPFVMVARTWRCEEECFSAFEVGRRTESYSGTRSRDNMIRASAHVHEESGKERWDGRIRIDEAFHMTSLLSPASYALSRLHRVIHSCIMVRTTRISPFRTQPHISHPAPHPHLPCHHSRSSLHPSCISALYLFSHPSPTYSPCTHR